MSGSRLTHYQLRVKLCSSLLMMSPLLVFSAGSALILADSSWFMLIVYAVVFAVLYFKYGRSSSGETARAVAEEDTPAVVQEVASHQQQVELPGELVDKELPKEPEELPEGDVQQVVQDLLEQPEELEPSETQQLLSQEPPVQEDLLSQAHVEPVQQELPKELIQDDLSEHLQSQEEPMPLVQENLPTAEDLLPQHRELVAKSRSSSESSSSDTEEKEPQEVEQSNLVGSAAVVPQNEGEEEEEEPSTLSKVQDLLRRSSKSSGSSSEDEAETDKSDKKDVERTQTSDEQASPAAAVMEEDVGRNSPEEEEKIESDPTSLEIVDARPEAEDKLEEAFEVREAPEKGESNIYFIGRGRDL